MAKPSSHLDWTIGNPNFGTVTIEPTTGKKITGWTPGEPPAMQHMNWVFYNQDQWDKYLEGKTDDHETRLVNLEGSLFSTNLVQEIPSGVANGSNLNFTLTQTPSNPQNLFLYEDGLLVDRAQYTVSGRNIVFNAGFAPADGSDILSVYVIQTGFSGQIVQSGGQGMIPKTETRTLTTAEISAGQLTLAMAPHDAANTIVDVIEDGPQAYGTDFTITGSVMTWASLGMSAAIGAGSIVRIQYFI
jgi:hypothetical protein